MTAPPELPANARIVGSVISDLILACYLAGFHAAHGKTPGKSLMHISVVDQAGQKLPPMRAFPPRAGGDRLHGPALYSVRLRFPQPATARLSRSRRRQLRRRVMKKTFASRAQSRRLRLGIYGGTFDPVHHGHLLLARDAMEQLRLDAILFVPASRSPFKAHKAHATDAQRATMLRWA